MGAPGERPLRCDAARNRDAILEAARAAFAEEGVGVPLEEIARRAGVGIATLYRRFPTRDELVAAAFAPKVTAYVAAADTASAAEDPWTGFSGFVRTVCAMQAADAGFADVITLTFPATATLDRRLRATTGGMQDVVARAKAAGELREDFVLEDIVVLLLANAGVVNATKDHAPDAWERFVAYMLDAFHAPSASPLPPPVPARRLARIIRRRRAATAALDLSR